MGPTGERYRSRGDDDAPGATAVDPLGAKMQRARIVDAFKLKLGSTEDDVRATTASNPFGDGRKPWVSVKNPSRVTPNPTKQALFEAAVDWTSQRLDDAPFPVAARFKCGHWTPRQLFFGSI